MQAYEESAHCSMIQVSFSKFLSFCRQHFDHLETARTQFSGGGQIPRYGRVEDGDAWLPVCHLCSLSNLLPCFLAGMQGAMHCSFLPDPLGFIKQVMCSDSAREESLALICGRQPVGSWHQMKG